MLDLIQLWKNTQPVQKPDAEEFKRSYPQGAKQLSINFDNNTVQSSFEFKNNPTVIFVKNISSLEPANFYDELPEVALTPEENRARLETVTEQMDKNPRFYDGNQMVITSVAYEETTNTLYMEAKQVPYSFIVALNTRKFPHDSALYQQNFFKTGVLAPLISTDGKSVLLQRKADGLFSVPAGFLEPFGRQKKLNNFKSGQNLVVKTAAKEIKEELVGIGKSKQVRFNISKPTITALSFRQTGPMKTVEFVAPVHADCHSSYLQQVCLNNKAKDAHEHTTEHQIIDLRAKERNKLIELLLTGPNILPGAGLYLPVVLSLTGLANPDGVMALPRRIANSASVAWPLRLFHAAPQAALSEHKAEIEIEVDTEDEPFIH